LVYDERLSSILPEQIVSLVYKKHRMAEIICHGNEAALHLLIKQLLIKQQKMKQFDADNF
jgi:hypothetical protein